MAKLLIPRHGKHTQHWLTIHEVVEIDEFNKSVVVPIRGMWVVRKAGLKRQLVYKMRDTAKKRPAMMYVVAFSFLMGMWVTLLIQHFPR
jgi:hypothetical protein